MYLAPADPMNVIDAAVPLPDSPQRVLIRVLTLVTPKAFTGTSNTLGFGPTADAPDQTFAPPTGIRNATPPNL